MNGLATTTRATVPGRTVPTLLMAFCVTLAAFAIDAAKGWQLLHVMGIDNDSQMRLVEVRDLMAGQGWFDLHQYRLGMPEGSSMHWSRLVDAPIALIIWFATAVTGNQASGEMAALVLWPFVLMVAGVALAGVAARRFAGDGAAFPAVVIAAVTFYSIGVFGPGAIDHHNVQIVLTLGVLASLLGSIERPHQAAWAGAMATLGLTIGMETAGYVAFAGIAVGGWYLLKGEAAARQTINFGLGFAGAAIVALAITRRPSDWFAVECDAYSAPQFWVAVVAGFGIAAVARFASRDGSGIGRRAAALLLLGAALGALLLVAYPQCLAKPYADLDPRLRHYFMSGIIEAQPMWTIMRSMPTVAANAYGPVLVALVWLGVRIARQGLRVEDGLVLAFLAPAAMVSIYQLRGANFALAFAIAPLAAMIANQRALVVSESGVANSLRLVGAWLISANMAWMMTASALVANFTPGALQARDQQLLGANTCIQPEDFARLGAMAPARVVSILNLGSSILRYTPHHAYAGPYHRNNDGNLVAINMLSATPDAAKAIAADNGIELVVVCRGNSESSGYGAGSLQEELTQGRAPGWLSLVPETAGASLEIYRVRAE